MNYGKTETSRKKKELDSKSAKMSKKGFVVFIKALLFGAIALCVIGVCAGVGLVQGIIANAPEITLDSIAPSGAATFVYDSEGEQIEKLAASSSNRIYVTLDEIPKYLQNAVVAIEDERFYEHNGIDVKGIARAFVVNITSGGLSEGASTITQQLLKNNVFTNWTNESSNFERIERKIQEQYLAIVVEQAISKEKILENYLNAINLGDGAYGVQAAAKTYFDKDVSELTLSESAMIAGITQNPTGFNPKYYPENNKKRQQRVLKNMLDQGYITQAEHDEAVNDNVYARLVSENDEEEMTNAYSYFVDEVITQATQLLMEQMGYDETQAEKALFSGGLRIHTTQDSKIQQIMDEEFSNDSNFPSGVQWYLEYALSVQKKDGTVVHHSKEMLMQHFRETYYEDFNLLFDSKEEGNEFVEQYKEEVLSLSDEIIGERIDFTAQPQATMVIMDQYTGEIKALVGGRGKKESSLTLNRATQSTRSPGSIFKVLTTYAPALDLNGKTLADVYYNGPYSYSNGQELKNWDSGVSGFTGYTTIRQSIEASINVTAVKAIQEVKPANAFDYLSNFGFSTLVDSDKVEPLALGGITNGVTNLELTAAYASIANAGTYIEPIFITKITDQSGNVMVEVEADTKKETVMKETTAYLLTSAMQDVVTGDNGTGKALKLDNNMPVAGKTGTTDDYKDIWFSGYTPYYTCTVWSGYDSSMLLGDDERDYNKTLWQKVMSRVHADLPVTSFTEPVNLSHDVEICKKSGLRATSACKHDPRGDMSYKEVFELGTEPQESCNRHTPVTICNTSGLKANAYCTHTSSKGYMFIDSNDLKAGDTDDTNYAAPSATCTIHKKPEPETKESESEKDDDDDDDNNSSGGNNSGGDNNGNGNNDGNGGDNNNGGSGNNNSGNDGNGGSNSGGDDNSGGNGGDDNNGGDSGDGD